MPGWRLDWCRAAAFPPAHYAARGSATRSPTHQHNVYHAYERILKRVCTSVLIRIQICTDINQNYTILSPDNFNTQSKIQKIMASTVPMSMTLMRKIKQCKMALLWIKVKKSDFLAFVKLGIGSGSGTDPQHGFALYLAACMKTEYLSLLAILKWLSETGKSENPSINTV